MPFDPSTQARRPLDPIGTPFRSGVLDCTRVRVLGADGVGYDVGSWPSSGAEEEKSSDQAPNRR